MQIENLKKYQGVFTTESEYKQIQRQNFQSAILLNISENERTIYRKTSLVIDTKLTIGDRCTLKPFFAEHLLGKTTEREQKKIVGWLRYKRMDLASDFCIFEAINEKKDKIKIRLWLKNGDEETIYIPVNYQTKSNQPTDFQVINEIVTFQK